MRTIACPRRDSASARRGRDGGDVRRRDRDDDRALSAA